MARLFSPRIGRPLRITATALMLMASAGLVTLWIRNFWRADVAWLPLPSGGNVMIVSQKGQMEVVISTPAAAVRQAMPPRHDVALCGVDSYSIIREGASDVLFPSWKPLRYRRLWEGGKLNI